MILWKCCTQYANNLENSAVATGLEKVSFHSNPKDRQCQRMFKLPHNCTHLTLATHSSILAWRIPGTEQPGGLPSMESHRVGHNWSNLAAAAVIKPCSTVLWPHGLCRLPGSSVHMIFQARILEWVVISFSKGSFLPRDQIRVSCIGRQILYHWVTWEAWYLMEYGERVGEIGKNVLWWIYML